MQHQFPWWMKVCKIEPILNEENQRVYDAVRENLSKRSKVNEILLYHGTDECVIDKIIVNGFNRTFSTDRKVMPLSCCPPCSIYNYQETANLRNFVRLYRPTCI